jgi:hypothetical protein
LNRFGRYGVGVSNAVMSGLESNMVMSLRMIQGGVPLSEPAGSGWQIVIEERLMVCQSNKGMMKLMVL